MFFAARLDGANQIEIARDFFSAVIPGRPKDEPGIHRAAGASGEMDSGLAASRRPGMTAEKIRQRFQTDLPVQPSHEKHSASVVGQISDLTPRVSPE